MESDNPVIYIPKRDDFGELILTRRLYNFLNAFYTKYGNEFCITYRMGRCGYDLLVYKDRSHRQILLLEIPYETLKEFDTDADLVTYIRVLLL